MTLPKLQKHPVVLALLEIQSALQLKDIPFAELLRFDLHGSNWGKIKKGTYTGRPQAALDKFTVALEAYNKSQGQGLVEDGVVLLDHVEQAINAVEIALANDDEHGLVVLVGNHGRGKSATLSLILSKFGGIGMSARPSWKGSYLNFLNNVAAALGLSPSRNPGDAETLILSHLQTKERSVLAIDEFNHFSADAVNFIKTILNETRWKIIVATIPHHLARLAGDRSTAQESRQFLRRAVAIIHIGAITNTTVEQLQRGLWPQLPVGEHAKAISVMANRLHGIDTVTQILADAENVGDIPMSIARHERACQVTLNPSAA